jgi:hypothetical protein
MPSQWSVHHYIKDLAWDLNDHIEAVIKQAESVDSMANSDVPEKLKAIAGLARIIRKRLDDLEAKTDPDATKKES